MAIVTIPLVTRAPFRTAQWIRNGYYPQAGTQTRLVEDANHVSRWLTKSLEFRCPTFEVPALSATARTRWRAMLHTSPHTRYIWCRFLMAQIADTLGTAHASKDPFGRVLLEETDGTDVGTADFHFGYSVTSDEFNLHPSGLGVGMTRIGDGNNPVEVNPDTDYVITVSDEQSARIIGVSIWEEMLASNTNNGYLDSTTVAGSPIMSVHRSGPVQMMRTAWKRQGSPLLHWASNTDALAPTRTSADAANWILQSLTTASAASPGYTLSLANRSTVRRTTVPCVFWVYAKSSGGGDATVTLRNSSDIDVVSVAISSDTADWYSEVVNLPATDGKYDLFIAGDDANAMTFYAASLWQYE